MLTDKRLALKPVQYQWAYDYWYKTQNSHWMFTEINMQSDIKDWSEMSEIEKTSIAYILKGFAQTEMEVKTYWSKSVPDWFPVPEIQNMAVAFANWETIHAYAYDYLNETLGIKDYEGFMQDEAIMNKLEGLMVVNDATGVISNIQKARSIAVFSAACEGIQLFSSFSVLLSFRLKNKLKGIGQQMFWSIRDESTHSEAGCKLFRTMCEEYKREGDVDLRMLVKDDVEQAIASAIQQEFIYIDKVFENGDLPSITAKQVKNFMFDRANRKLIELGYNTTEVKMYVVDSVLLKEMDWFYLMISSEQQTDFFDNRETNYSKGNPDWNNDDLYNE